MPSRAAIYARYSSDNQRDASIEDQVRSCQARADREGLQVVEVFSDHAISGSTSSRPGWKALIQAAEDGRIDVVLTEALDRLSRDQEHIAGFYKRLCFAGVRIVTVSEGDISELHIGLKGTMNALFLKDLAIKTRRGIEGRVRAGRSGGGLCYGYRVVRRLDATGAAVTGEREIVAGEAALIRQIFLDYLNGESPRSMACRLNRSEVPGPRKGKWTASLILGNAERETGILRNRLYAGTIVWNRQRYIKDPATGRRVSRVNPRSDWVVEPVPNLAIVAPDVWASVQERLNDRRRAVSAPSSTHASKPEDGHHAANRGARLGVLRRPVWLLAGLVTCGPCGGPMTVVCSNGRLRCANHRERGTCSNQRTILREKVVQRVLVGLKTRLLTPELVDAFAVAFNEETAAASTAHLGIQRDSVAERAKIDRQLENLLGLMKDGGGSRSMANEVRLLERRQDELEARAAAAACSEPVLVDHPDLAQVYREIVQNLEDALSDASTAAAATTALRCMIDRIFIHPLPGWGQSRMELRG